MNTTDEELERVWTEALKSQDNFCEESKHARARRALFELGARPQGDHYPDDKTFARMVKHLAKRGRLVLLDQEGGESGCEFVADDPRHPKLTSGMSLDAAVVQAARATGFVEPKLTPHKY